MLLDGINHIAVISKDVAALGRFYAEVFEAEVGPTRPHGQDPGETMTNIRIGPHTEFNVVTIEGNVEPDRQTLLPKDGAGVRGVPWRSSKRTGACRPTPKRCSRS